jgi:acetyltransferase-like isoleucine patch superfamily enzyme
MLTKLFAAAYYRLRGHHMNTEALPTSVLATFVFHKASDLVRGIVKRPLYGSAQGMHFRGPRVSVRHPRYLHLGSHVVLGAGVHIDAFSVDGIRLGSRVTIGEDANILGTAVIREQGVGVQVGDDTSIGRSNIIWGQGGVKIGANCLLGPDVSIFSENHVYEDPDIPIRLQGNHRQGVTIEDDCWIGAGAKILAGVLVGRGSVVAAGAVVSKSIDAYSVVGGVPAKKIGTRASKKDSVAR